MLRNDEDRLLEKFVNKYGAERTLARVAELRRNVELREEEVRLGSLESYRFFTTEDWMAYSGCARFDDGVRPIISYDFRVVVDCNFEDNADLRTLISGKVYEFVLIVAPDEAKDNAALVTMYDSDFGLIVSKSFSGRNAALITLGMIQRLPQPVRFSELFALGFEVHNP